MIIKTTSTVLLNEPVAENIYRIELLSPEISAASKPGQFINVKGIILTLRFKIELKIEFSLH